MYVITFCKNKVAQEIFFVLNNFPKNDSNIMQKIFTEVILDGHILVSPF
jgi:hypothetical protein